MKNRNAFTLVEMLAVIAILMVLMGLLLPVFLRLPERARVATAREDIHQLTTAWKGYLNRYRQFPMETDGSLVLIEEMDTNAISILLGDSYNPENLHFMEFKESHLQNGFLDPWGDRAGQG